MVGIQAAKAVVQQALWKACDDLDFLLLQSKSPEEGTRKAFAQYSTDKCINSNDQRAKQVIENFLTDPSPLVREAMAYKLTVDSMSTERWLRGLEDESWGVRKAYLRESITRFQKLPYEVAERMLCNAGRAELQHFLHSKIKFVWKSKLLNEIIEKAVRMDWEDVLAKLLSVDGSHKIKPSAIDAVIESYKASSNMLISLAYSGTNLSDKQKKSILGALSDKDFIEALKVLWRSENSFSTEMVDWSWKRLYGRLESFLIKKSTAKSAASRQKFAIEFLEGVSTFSANGSWVMPEEAFKKIQNSMENGILFETHGAKRWWAAIAQEGAQDLLRWQKAWLEEKSGIDSKTTLERRARAAL